MRIYRYRKFHLFNEGNAQHTQTPDLKTFETDFNVTFGISICFDILFDEPMDNLVQKGVVNFVYPTRWYSELPYLTGI